MPRSLKLVPSLKWRPRATLQRSCAVWLTFLVVFWSDTSASADDGTLEADFSVPIGRIRPLHGINKGPLVPGGLLNLVEEQKALGIPFVRLHDCGWPNPFVVDHHVVFPDPKADPSKPESYDFRLTDEYIAAVRETGAEPIYRLGESIEHTAIKRFVHPPADPEKWAAACLGILRHYNEGWPNGVATPIRYWEIWNEPENRPAMWSGTDEDYFRLYRVTATAIQKRFPQVKVGGPAVGASGTFIHGVFQPTAFVTNFLSMCRRDHVPLNFFSWHAYTDRPGELVERATAIRQLLDAYGFTETESHLNEWNYLPGKDWKPLTPGAQASIRQTFYEQMSGTQGAAFVTSALIELQDAPIDLSTFFHGEAGAFGLFTEHGVPTPVYQAVRAFQQLVTTPRRVETRGAIADQLALCAGLSADGREATLLISNFAGPRNEFALQWQGFAWNGGVTAEFRILSARAGLSEVQTNIAETDSSSMRIRLPAPGVAVVRLRPRLASAEPSLTIQSPKHRWVFQRNLAGNAIVPVRGRCAWAGATIEARLIPRATGQPGPWQPVATVQSDLNYQGQLTADAGWYSLEIRARRHDDSATAVVDRVGVGEVFLVVGHSVAEGGDLNLPGATDDRVNTVALPIGDRERERRYLETGDPRFLPEFVGTHFGSGVRPAPAGNGPYFWASFAEQIAQAQNVPVLILNAACGGSSLEHWAKSAQGEPFEHPFIKSSLRMPYMRLEHALQRYCATTGLRAILADHGQNDRQETDESLLLRRYETWIAQARAQTGFPELTVVVNRRSPPGNAPQIRRVQERLIQQDPHCFAGPDYDRLAAADTLDQIHLNLSGETKAARLWAEALDAHFFQTVTPWIGRRQP